MASQSSSDGGDAAVDPTLPSARTDELVGDESTQPSAGSEEPSSQDTGPRPRRSNTLMLEAGEVLAGRYAILDHIGAGGMGHVYKAEHTTIRKLVAIKTLSRDYSAKPELVDRFLQEARAASLIRHPNIVDITDFGHAENGTPFIAMEYLEGEDLGDTLERERRIEWGRARAMMKQILMALQAAHDRGVIHRDMKPENCFRVSLDHDPDFIKVVDFGIAKVQAPDGETSEGLTQTGAVMGTAAYMSPEQAKSLPLDARADVYSAGVILYQLLTGTVPFKANGFVAVLYKHIADAPEPPRKRAPDAGLTREMEAVVLKALAKDPADRFQSAQEFYEAIRDVNDQSGGIRAGGSALLWGSVAVGALLVAGGIGWGAGLFGGAAPEARAEAATEGQPDADTAAVAVADGEGEQAVVADLPDSEAVAPAVDTDGVPAGEDGDTDGAPVDTEGAEGAEEAEEDAPAPTPKPRPKSKAKAKTSTKATAEAPPAGPAETLDTAAIKSTLAGVRTKVLACGTKYGALPGTKVSVSISVGASGDVASAKAAPPFATSPLGACVSGVVEGVEFPSTKSGKAFKYSFVVAK